MPYRHAKHIEVKNDRWYGVHAIEKYYKEKLLKGNYCHVH